MAIDQPVVIQGTVKDAVDIQAPGANMTKDGDTVTLSFATPPPGPVEISATDAAGNKVVATVVVPVEYPQTNGVHVGADEWADPALKAGILQMIAEGRINAVELDLKNEQGTVGYGSHVQLANDIGAVKAKYDLPAAVAELHGLGVRVVGRIVAFLDPVLAHAAWARGDKDWVLQTPDGQPLGSDGGFTNYVQPDVRAYNLAIAEEAARAGVDDILWDYVRRPEGEPASMVVPGLVGASSDAIGGFLQQGHELLRPLGVYQGASVLGISATRPQSIAQDVPLIAKHVDYLAPTLYPERWGRTEYGVADPQAQPYDIVLRSLADFQTIVEPHGSRPRAVAAGLRRPRGLRPLPGEDPDGRGPRPWRGELVVLELRRPLQRRGLPGGTTLTHRRPTVTAMERSAYLDTISSESAAFHAAAGAVPLDAAVPACPDWTVADLVYHLGEVHHFWGEVAGRRLASPDVDVPERPAPEELIAWGRAQAARLHETLAAADPATAVWTWASQKDVAFIQRRMAQETAVHRWDAESAGGTARPIDADGRHGRCRRVPDAHAAGRAGGAAGRRWLHPPPRHGCPRRVGGPRGGGRLAHRHGRARQGGRRGARPGQRPAPPAVAPQGARRRRGARRPAGGRAAGGPHRAGLTRRPCTRSCSGSRASAAWWWAAARWRGARSKACWRRGRR